MAKVTTSVEVSLHDPYQGGDYEDVWRLEAAKRQVTPPDGPAIGPVSSYFLVFPGAAGLILETTSGSVNSEAVGCSKRVWEMVSFNGDTMAVPLGYPHAKNVTFSICGRMFHAESHNITAIHVTYDSTRNEMRVNTPAIGLLKVGYDAPYDLWRAVFHQRNILLTKQAPMPHQQGFRSGPDPEDEEEPKAEPMLIVGKRASPTPEQDPNEIVCSLSLEPPDWGGLDDDDPTKQYGGPPASGTESSMPKLKLSIDPYNPVRMLDTAFGIPAAGCHILCTPGVTPQFVTTSGSIIGSESAESEVVQENIVFSGSPSATLAACPQGTVSVEADATFIDAWGNPFAARIAVPGQRVTVVQWLSENTYKHSGYRVVGPDELVVLDEMNNVIPAYGFCRVAYVASYTRHEFRFSYGDGRFLNSWVLGQSGNQTATLQLSPPNIRAL